MTEISLSQFQDAVGMQNDARRTMRENNTPQKLGVMLQEELDELIRGVGEYQAKSENQNSNLLKEMLVGSEIADILFLCLSLADKMGIDASASLERKMKRNIWKYPFEMFNDGISYEEAHVMCKELWQQEGGDRAFYETELGVQLTNK